MKYFEVDEEDILGSAQPQENEPSLEVAGSGDKYLSPEELDRQNGMQEFEVDQSEIVDAAPQEQYIEVDEADASLDFEGVRQSGIQQQQAAAQAQQLQQQQAAQAQQEQAARDADPKNWSSSRFKKEAPKPKTPEEQAVFNAEVAKKKAAEDELTQRLLPPDLQKPNEKIEQPAVPKILFDSIKSIPIVSEALAAVQQKSSPYYDAVFTPLLFNLVTGAPGDESVRERFIQMYGGKGELLPEGISFEKTRAEIEKRAGEPADGGGIMGAAVRGVPEVMKLVTDLGEVFTNPRFAHEFAVSVGADVAQFAATPFSYAISPMIKYLGVPLATKVASIKVGETTLGSIMSKVKIGPNFVSDMDDLIKRGIAPKAGKAPSAGAEIRGNKARFEEEMRKRGAGSAAEQPKQITGPIQVAERDIVGYSPAAIVKPVEVPASAVKPVVLSPVDEMLEQKLMTAQQAFAQKMPGSEKMITPYDTAEIIAARQRAAAHNEENHTIKIETPERAQLRKKIADDVYGAGALTKNREIDIVMGLPGSGKSSSLAEPIAKKNGSIIIDSDTAKEYIPEFNGGQGAGLVHRESSHIIDDLVLTRAVENGDNIVFPVVGRSLEGLQELMKDLAEAGYKIRLHHLDVPLDVSAQSVVKRFYKTGRFVDPDYVVNQVGLKPSQNYDILKKSEGVSVYGKYQRGTKPREVIQVESGGSERPGRLSGENSERGSQAAQRVEKAEEVKLDKAAPEDFNRAISAFNQGSDYKGYVTVYPPEKYADMQVYLNPEKNAGYAITPEKEIASVFNGSKTPGLGKEMLRRAVEQGGNHLYAFDGFLAEYYRKKGFVEVERYAFDDALAPEGWDFAKNQRPDVVKMEYKGAKNDRQVEAAKAETRGVQQGNNPGKPQASSGTGSQDGGTDGDSGRRAVVPEGPRATDVKLPPPKTPQTAPVRGSGETKPSRFFERVKSRIEELSAVDVDYNPIKLAEDTAAALSFVEKFPENARRVALGLEFPPTGVTKTAVSVAQVYKAEDLANEKNTPEAWNEYAKILSATSRHLTRAGQEVSAARGFVNENTTPHFVQQVIRARLENAGAKITPSRDTPSKTHAERATARVKQEVETVKKVLTKRQLDIASAQKILDSLIC